MTREIDGREHLAIGDGLDGIGDAVDADHLGLAAAACRSQRLDDAHRHVVICRDDRVDVGEALHEVLEHLLRRQTAVLTRLRGQHSMPGKSFSARSKPFLRICAVMAAGTPSIWTTLPLPPIDVNRYLHISYSNISSSEPMKVTLSMSVILLL